ncbi:MAG TPA: pirin family protein [Chitinophagaceae bacterium]|nr:pirin family protein [Chitinophagaceae bacterium]
MLISRASERHIIDKGKFIIRLVSPGRKLLDPADPNGLGPLGRMDHSTLDPGMIIPMHPHVNDEILSYMRKGQMMHRDSKGHIELLYGHHMMMMNAGKEFYHEETCMDDNEDGIEDKVEMLQIFFRPKEDDMEPQVQFHNFEFYHSIDLWRMIGGPEDSDAPLKIRSQAWFFDAHLEQSSIETPDLDQEGYVGFLYVFEGSVEIEGTGEVLQKGDNAVFQHEQYILTAQEPTDLVFFILDTRSKYSRNGMYAK